MSLSPNLQRALATLVSLEHQVESAVQEVESYVTSRKESILSSEEDDMLLSLLAKADKLYRRATLAAMLGAAGSKELAKVCAFSEKRLDFFYGHLVRGELDVAEVADHIYQPGQFT